MRLEDHARKVDDWLAAGAPPDPVRGQSDGWVGDQVRAAVELIREQQSIVMRECWLHQAALDLTRMRNMGVALYTGSDGKEHWGVISFLEDVTR